jgi:uncharacterized protein (TIGR02453 family)
VAFKGWPADALHFYEGLEADNSKAYWQDNKEIYEQSVRAPMEELIAELAPEFGAGKLFRPYRDVRFSKDKSPYKTAIATSLAGGGYVHLSAEGLAVGCGMYHMEPEQLERFRAAVDDETTGREIAAIVETVRKAGMLVTGHDTLKTAPKGYPKDHPRIDLLRQKGLVTWQQWPVEPWLGTRKAKDRVVKALRTSAPLNEWLQRHVGSTQS